MLGNCNVNTYIIGNRHVERDVSDSRAAPILIEPGIMISFQLVISRIKGYKRPLVEKEKLGYRNSTVSGLTYCIHIATGLREYTLLD